MKLSLITWAQRCASAPHYRSRQGMRLAFDRALQRDIQRRFNLHHTYDIWNNGAARQLYYKLVERRMTLTHRIRHQNETNKAE
jgi:hypothetical protein